jgi:hypothetical protein
MFSREYERELDKYKTFYKTIRSIRCPYFNNEEVFFNKKGFNHLIRKSGDRRFHKDQKRRLVLLKYCREILRGNYIEVEFRVNQRNKTGYFWCFKARIESVATKLIVRQIGSGTKHFFDIFPIKH